MNWTKIFTIYKKELLDIFRDKRTVITSIIIPLILYPILIVGVNSLMSRQTEKLKGEKSSIIIEDKVKNSDSEKIIKAILKDEKLELEDSVNNIDAKFRNKDIQAKITISDTLLNNYQKYRVKVTYDNSNDKSKIVLNQIEKILKKTKENFLKDRLIKKKIDLEILETIKVTKNNIAPPEKMLGFLVGKILPYLLIILTISGGAVASSDLVAGEKERGTLETILVSAASRTELVIGKYLTIITISMITVILNLFSVYISLKHVLDQSGVNMTTLNLPISKFGLILLAMIPIASLFSAILLMISTYSRNMKETKSFESPLIVIAMMLSMISFFPGFKLNIGMALIPVINISLLFKDIMLNEMNLVSFLVVIGSTIILDIIALKISVDLFKKETVLFKTTTDEVENNSLKEKFSATKIFSPQFGMIIYIIVFLLMFYVASKLQQKSLFKGLIQTQLLIITLPPLLLLKLGKIDWKKTLKLNKIPRISELIFVLAATLPIISISSYLAIVLDKIYPIPDEYIKFFQELMVNNDIGLLSTILVIGILPGICEEILFRGYLFKSFRKLGKWQAIIITSILFSAIHMDIFRAIPIFVIAIWLGYLRENSQTLILVMFAHALNNSTAVLINNFSSKNALLHNFVLEPNFWYFLVASLIFGLIAFGYSKLHKDKQLT